LGAEVGHSSQTRPIHADRALAARLEALAAAEMRRFVETSRAIDRSSEAAFVEVGGGVAAYLSSDSLVNQAVGMGLSEPVSERDVAVVERFYGERGTRGVMSLCPLADPTLAAALAARGWVPDDFENVLVRGLDSRDAFAQASDAIAIQEVATDDDRETWALVAATGFSAPLPPLKPQMELGRIVVRRPGARLFLAQIDGLVVGTAELYVDDGVAWLSGDTTLPPFQGRGVQAALQRHRLALGAVAGCELAVSEARPGSGSQRNMERLGFRVAYTRIDVRLPAGEMGRGDGVDPV